MTEGEIAGCVPCKLSHGWHQFSTHRDNKAALLQAYQRAGVDPADVQLIEGHGIGTAAGDSAD